MFNKTLQKVLLFALMTLSPLVLLGCANLHLGAPVAATTNMFEITSEAQFEAEVTKSQLPVCSYYYDGTQSRSVRHLPTIHQEANKYTGKVKFVLIDIERYPTLLNTLGECRKLRLPLLQMRPAAGQPKVTYSYDSLDQFEDDVVKVIEFGLTLMGVQPIPQP